MLLGYNKNGDIQFIFTDEKYLAMKYPNNTAKISNFWGTVKHDLTELFVPISTFIDWDNYKNYRIVNSVIVKKTKEEINKNNIKKKIGGMKNGSLTNKVPKKIAGEIPWKTEMENKSLEGMM